MTIKALILLILLAQTPHHKDTENWEEREARMSLVADEIAASVDLATCRDHEQIEGEPECVPIWPASRKALAVLLTTQAIFESNLAQHVHENRCNLEKGECDARRAKFEGKWQFFQKAYSIWQLQWFRDIPRAHWKEIERGVPGTRWAAWHATRRLASAYRACGTIEGAISRYARGSGCQWKHATKRKDLWQKLMAANPETMKKAAATIQARVEAREKEMVGSSKIAKLEFSERRAEE